MQQAIQAAIAAFQAGDFQDAAQRCEAMLAQDAECFFAINMLAVLHAQHGHVEQGLSLFARAAKLRPLDASVLNNHANVLNDLKRFDEALALYQKALALQPDNPQMHNNCSMVLKALKRFDEALLSCERAVALAPEMAEVWNNQGTVLQALERKSEAAASYEQALRLSPGYVDALINLSAVMLSLGRLDEALARIEHAIELQPKSPDAWDQKGIVLQSLHCDAEALACHDKALQLSPGNVRVLGNRSAVLKTLQRFEEALSCCEQALQTDPRDEVALCNSACLLSDMSRVEQAIAMFERLLAVNPDYSDGLGLLCYERLMACDWSGFEGLAQSINAGIAAGRSACKPLHYMAIADSAELAQRCAQRFAQTFITTAAPLWTGERYSHKRLRLAYVSPDLREHPVAHLMAGVFEQHDKSRFETVAISLGPDDGSALRTRVRQAFDEFVDARHWSDRQIAQWMREREIDIAVDLAGYTMDARPGLWGHRAAPMQVSYLGFPGTLGQACMDVIIAQRDIVPPEQQSYIDERVVYLPHNYLPTDSRLQIATHKPTRAQCGLPEEGFVFCSFCQEYKVSPSVFAVWLRLLQAVPGSVLWLVSRSELTQRNLRRAAQAQGVAPERLVFASRLPRVEDHLARYTQADLFLDTHPYNAHTTATDALRTGLPVLTYMGESFASRVAGSLLLGLQLPELVTHSLQAYEARALELATQPAALAALKAKLAVQIQQATLFDTTGFCRDLEALLLDLSRPHA